MTKSTIDSKIDRIIETLLVRPLNTPGAYAETEKLKGAIKALLTEARIDEAKQIWDKAMAIPEDKRVWSLVVANEIAVLENPSPEPSLCTCSRCTEAQLKNKEHTNG